MTGWDFGDFGLLLTGFLLGWWITHIVRPAVRRIKGVSSIDVSRIWRALGQDDWLTPQAQGASNWSFSRADGTVLVCVSVNDRRGWVHASITRRDEAPTQADLEMLHRAVFNGGWAYQVFMPPGKLHVDASDRILHLFGSFNGEPRLVP